MDKSSQEYLIAELKAEKLAKGYIKLPIHKNMDTEERYYNPRTKEYDAFIAGYLKAKTEQL